MFGGIVEGSGTILRMAQGAKGGRVLSVRSPFDDVRLGDSVAVNGVCLTATSIQGGEISMDVGPESLARTTLGGLSVGDRVNLERALAYGARIGGHLVQGHVDDIGVIRQVLRRENAIDLEVEVPREILRFIAPRGGVAVDGISLTVTGVGPSSFSLSIIPHTWSVTTLCERGVGARVNVEVDLFARYIARLLEVPSGSGLSLDRLESLGYGSRPR